MIRGGEEERRRGGEEERRRGGVEEWRSGGVEERSRWVSFSYHADADADAEVPRSAALPLSRQVARVCNWCRASPRGSALFISIKRAAGFWAFSDSARDIVILFICSIHKE
jgi:hypothetical protein